MIIGVSTGFKKELELVGVGYQASAQGNRLKLQLGFSHDIFFDVPQSIKISAERTLLKLKVLINNLLVLSQRKYAPLDLLNHTKEKG